VLLKNKQLLAGIAIGGIIASTGVALADQNSVTATIENWIKFQFNGVEKTLPEGFNVLNYNGRVYVPARFVAEQLGGKVEWDSSTQKIKVTSDLQNQIDEQQQQIEKLKDQLADLQNQHQVSNAITGSGVSDDKYKIDDLNVSINYNNNGEMKSITINGKFTNVSTSSQRPKNILVILYDTNNTSIGIQIYPFNSQLTINESQPFSIPIFNPPAHIHHYTVRIE
jgi:gas vesicle protein